MTESNYWAAFLTGAGTALFLCWLAWFGHQLRTAEHLLITITERDTDGLAQVWAEGNTNGLLGFGEDMNPYVDADADQDRHDPLLPGV